MGRDTKIEWCDMSDEWYLRDPWEREPMVKFFDPEKDRCLQCGIPMGDERFGRFCDPDCYFDHVDLLRAMKRTERKRELDPDWSWTDEVHLVPVEPEAP